MLCECSLLERYVLSRQSLSGHTLRKDLFALPSIVRNVQHPEFTEVDRREAEAFLQEAVEVLGRPAKKHRGRLGQRQAIKDKVKRDELAFDSWMMRLEEAFRVADKPVQLHRRAISTLWVPVTRHIFHQCSALVGFANTSRLTASDVNLPALRKMRGRLGRFLRLRMQAHVISDVLLIKIRGSRSTPSTSDKSRFFNEEQVFFTG
ncbi:uncharacterized protein LOC127750616 [Frankliniella occidentalis]|uniref:Uncharacterized protein LOC127750616 n=1 Tax=Frankliniella occidentalis TaxID=133901 RepID=A0A9C6XRU5_FRAOC|nr:uncharacterized protein LOC127750616 [Frankliniella occidentalis]